MNFGLIAVNRETIGAHPEAQPCGAGRIRQCIKISVVVCTAATFLVYWYKMRVVRCMFFKIWSCFLS